ncbi:MAG: FeMo cofactor biosynthesis protein NifB [Syntrophorhabdaceae bacterium PtaU1.Bin034]|nr:MAG: FeMo cofactor biosynthesis protein NifB [Syntrophorhabdaceae bacterium PtaU1.Bin034]
MNTCFKSNGNNTAPEGLERHPCFSARAHNKFGRIHLPVSPACNIQCRFCKRGFNKWEIRPGVAASLIKPEKAVKIVERARRVCPELTVVGIAGPGDPLATDHALTALKLVHERFPDLILCLSTNGLDLPEKAEEVAAVGVKALTVTVNSVNSRILAHICAHVRQNGLNLTGEEGARRLIAAQLEGIKKMVRLGVVVKINTVLIPGINDMNIKDIARTVSRAGASMINIIPLIPQFEMASLRPPTAEELKKAQDEAEEYLSVFTHCRQCRADACGVPGTGKDYGLELYGRVAPTFSHG